MSISERIELTIERWRTKWGEALGAFIATAFWAGVTKVLDQIEDETRDEATASMGRLRDIPNLPPEFLTIIGEAEKKRMPQAVVAIIPYIIGMVIGTAMGAARPVANWMSYPIEKLIHSYRLDPASIINAWRRDKPTYGKLFDDLKDQGWSEDRLDVLRELAKIIPPLPDMVRFADFSAFDPEVIEAWRQFYDAPSWISEPMSLLGITNEAPRDWANKYWFSHFIQPGRYELGEMYRRGLLGEPLIGKEEIGEAGGEGEAEKTIKLAYKTMGYSAFWQDMLLELVRAIPTRVDVRRWWDMRTIDEEELRSLYQRQGYFGKDLENYVNWTKVYTDFSMMMTRFKNGWITEQDIRDWLKKLEIPEDRIQQFIEEKTKPEKGARVATERDLTATDIIMGVKKGIIAWAEGIELLMDLGYDEEEADFKLAVRIETEGGSPANMAEYKRLTQLWRVSQALPTKMTPAEIRAAEKELAEKYPLKVPPTEEELKVKVDTIRRTRRARRITRDEEIAGLLELGLTVELATAYADNDDLRLHPEKESK